MVLVEPIHVGDNVREYQAPSKYKLHIELTPLAVTLFGLSTTLSCIPGQNDWIE